MRLPPEEETTGKRGKSLTLTVEASESIEQDGEIDTLAMGLKIADAEPLQQHSGEKVAEVAKVFGVGIQRAEESNPRPQTDKMSGDKIEALDIVLLCVSGELNGCSVKFLIVSGATECFAGEAFTEKNRFHLT